jgi:hypothetical protein
LIWRTIKVKGQTGQRITLSIAWEPLPWQTSNMVHQCILRSKWSPSTHPINSEVLRLRVKVDIGKYCPLSILIMFYLTDIKLCVLEHSIE